MSGRAAAAARKPYHPPARGSSDPYRRPNRDIQKIIGASLMAVGAIFTLYGAGAGISKLVSVALNNFGLLCLTSIINFIFWSFIVSPLGALAINGLCAGAAFMLFSGVPAIPGALMVGTGAVVYFWA